MSAKSAAVLLCIIAIVMAYSRRPNEAGTRNTTSSPGTSMTLDDRTKDEAAIRQSVDNFVKAIRAKDVHGVLSIFAPEIVSFDLGPPLQHGGGAEFTKRWQELFESYPDQIDYEVRDLNVTVGDGVAFTHSLNRVSGTLKSGQRSDRWLRWTAGYRKTDGKWLIVHEQVSVPVDVRNGKAVLDLKP
jgi:uncharacterized protein (TIGR02246 family)